MRIHYLLLLTLAACAHGSVPAPLPPTDQLPARVQQTAGGVQVFLSSGLTKPNGMIIPAPA